MRRKKPTGKQIANRARHYVGVPYLHAGRTRSGVDCAGLLAIVAEDLKIPVVDDCNYSRVVNAERLRGILDQTLRTLFESEETQEGDVLLFDVAGSAQHMGIVTARDPYGHWLFAHAFESVGRVTETPLRLLWARNVVARLRWRAL